MLFVQSVQGANLYDWALFNYHWNLDSLFQTWVRFQFPFWAVIVFLDPKAYDFGFHQRKYFPHSEFRIPLYWGDRLAGSGTELSLNLPCYPEWPGMKILFFSVGSLFASMLLFTPIFLCKKKWITFWFSKHSMLVCLLFILNQGMKPQIFQGLNALVFAATRNVY